MVESGILRSAAFLAAFLAACFFITGANASPTDQVPPSPTHRKLQNDTPAQIQNDTSAKIQNDTSAKLSELPSADLQAADLTEEREAYIPRVYTNDWCQINPLLCRACYLHPWLPICGFGGRNRQDSEAVRADASDDVMAIKRQKGFIKGFIWGSKLFCKLFPKKLPCKLFGKLGRNRMDMAVEPVNADESYPSPSNDIEGPDSEMGNAESDVPPSPY